jgi:uncharacterized protein (UPF0261 family)
MAARPAVLLAGTFDTKAPELDWMAREIAKAGGRAVALDCSLRRSSARVTDGVAASEVAAAAGCDLAQIAALPRGEALTAMQAGVLRVALALTAQRRAHGLLCVGGAGADVCLPALQALPLGFPKLVVTPLASGERPIGRYVGLRDVSVLHSVADVAPMSPVLECVYRQAAGAIVGAARAWRRAPPPSARAPLIGMTTIGNTGEMADKVRAAAPRHGMETVPFHASGAGGAAMERLARDGDLVAMLDLTTCELTARHFGGLLIPPRGRFESPAACVPRVLAPGAIELLACTGDPAASQLLPGRPAYRHSDRLTLVRLGADEMATMGRELSRRAEELSRDAPVAVCVPTGGLSRLNRPGGLFWDPAADAAFVDALLGALPRNVPVRLVNGHLCDLEFAVTALQCLRGILRA